MLQAHAAGACCRRMQAQCFGEHAAQPRPLEVHRRPPARTDDRSRPSSVVQEVQTQAIASYVMRASKTRRIQLPSAFTLTLTSRGTKHRTHKGTRMKGAVAPGGCRWVSGLGSATPWGDCCRREWLLSDGLQTLSGDLCSWLQRKSGDLSSALQRFATLSK